MLQDALDGAVALLSAHVSIIATPALLKVLLGLQLCMEDREDLTMGVQLFTIGQNTITVQKR